MPIIAKNLSFVYAPKTPFERRALDGVSLTIADGSFTAIAGHTGSGKSTLIQHFNGLLTPTGGTVFVDDVDIFANSKAVKAAKQRVGMVFQFPEQQLFEETVAADVAFGPKNLGLSAAEIDERVKMALDFVGLDYAKFAAKSPFSLSGGEMRRAAIAGIIALRPKYLVLDEPTAGLDPAGREEMLERIDALHREQKIAIILVSHDMDAIYRYADRLIILNEGRVTLDAAPKDAFADEAIIKAAGLLLPRTLALINKLRAAGFKLPDKAAPRTASEAAEIIFRTLQKSVRA